MKRWEKLRPEKKVKKFPSFVKKLIGNMSRYSIELWQTGRNFNFFHVNLKGFCKLPKACIPSCYESKLSYVFSNNIPSLLSIFSKYRDVQWGGEGRKEHNRNDLEGVNSFQKIPKVIRKFPSS